MPTQAAGGPQGPRGPPAVMVRRSARDRAHARQICGAAGRRRLTRDDEAAAPPRRPTLRSVRIPEQVLDLRDIADPHELRADTIFAVERRTLVVGRARLPRRKRRRAHRLVAAEEVVVAE